jgi:hypothetical protein
MKSRIIYLAGPMKGYPEKNFPIFMMVAEWLRSLGHRVYNPAESESAFIQLDGTFDLRRAFGSYSTFISLEADTIVLLPGWENSMGAKAELGLADVCGLEILVYNEAEHALDEFLYQ